MDIDGAIRRYLDNSDVARWLFSTDETMTVTSDALDGSFVYSIGFGACDPNTPRSMNIEDMLIVCGTAGNFVLGVVWGLSQPHVFARTPLMLDKKPQTRRFAVDMSSRDSLEFMEFVTFDDGKIIVMFRQFLHTHDQSLPVIACARLHSASQVQHTLGAVLMRADLFEAACCPVCGLVGKSCTCTFESHAPNSAVRRSIYTWNQYSSQFMMKARMGTVNLRMTATLPNVGEMRIMDEELPIVNVLQKGATEYMDLMRRKAVHGLGVNVVMPQLETHVLPASLENDFVDLHNSYVSRKRIHESDDPSILYDTPQILDLSMANHGAEQEKSYSLESIDDNFQVYPSIAKTADSPLPSALLTSNFETPGAMKPSHQRIPKNFNDFVKQSPDSVLQTLMDPNTTRYLSGTGSDMMSAQRQQDILQDIELLLSPPGSCNANPNPPQTQGGPQSRDPTGTKSGSRRDVIPCASSVSSEDSSHHVTTRKSGPVAKKVRPTQKRAKPRSQAASENVSETDKRHVCESCSARFKMRGDLLRHVKTVHEGKKMYTCPTCNKAFGHSGHLNRHISSVHLQQRRFKCKLCGFPFFQQSHLQSHIKHIHSAKKPFDCKVCGLRVGSQAALQNHMSKSGCGELGSELPIACTFAECNSIFSSQQELASHNMLVHQNARTIISRGSQPPLLHS